MRFEVGKVYEIEMLILDENGRNPYTGDIQERFEKLEVLEPSENDLKYLEEDHNIFKQTETGEIFALDLNQSVKDGILRVVREL